MRGVPPRSILFALGSALLLFLCITPPQAALGQPPVGPQPVREGDFAIMLLNALEMGQVEDEIEAESRLGDAGITPRNGWIADYPTTPDVLGEIQNSVAEAAGARRIRLSADEALARLARTAGDAGLSIIAYSGNAPSAGGLAASENYPTPAEIAGSGSKLLRLYGLACRKRERAREPHEPRVGQLLQLAR